MNIFNQIKKSIGLLFFSAFILGCGATKVSAQTTDTTSVLKKLTDLYATVQKQNSDAKNQSEDLTNLKLRVEEDVKDATEKKLPKSDRRALQNKLNELTLQIDTAEKTIASTKLMIDDITDLFNAKYEKQKRFVDRYEKKFGEITLPNGAQYESVLQPAQQSNDVITKPDKLQQLENSSINQEIVIATGGSVEKIITEAIEKPAPKTKKQRAEKVTSKKVEAPKIVYSTYNITDDVMLSPPNLPCSIASNGVDNFTGKIKKETTPQVLLAFTDDLMRPQFKEKEFVTCFASAARLQGGFYFLTLRFEIATKDAQRTFGFFDRGVPFSFKLLNGRNINLPNIKTDIGVVDIQKGTTTYVATFQLYGSDVKNLTSAELDQVRVAWSAGLDDYEIYDINVLRHIFACLE